MKMLNRKTVILSGAALSAMPMLGNAAVINFAYDGGSPTTSLNDIQISNNSSFLNSGANTASVIPIGVNGAVSIPLNDYFRFGINVAVTGNANADSSADVAYDASNQANNQNSTANMGPGVDNQPAALGLSGWQYIVTDSKSSVAAPVVSGVTSTANVGSDSYDVKGAGNVNGTNGSVGDSPTSQFDGGYLEGNVDASNLNSSTLIKLTLGATAAQDLFSRLTYKATATGTTTITPVNQTGNLSYAVAVSAGSADGTVAPVYGSQAVSGSDTVGSLGSIVVTVTGGGHPIISLTNASSGSMANYGSQQGTNLALTSTGTAGSYTSVASTNFAAATTGYVTASGFSPTNDTEVYALKLSLPNGVTDAQVIADIDASQSNVNASAITGGYATLFPGYDLILTSTGGFTAGSGGATDLGFDFTQDTTHPGVEVVGVAAVPEPATAAGVVLGAAGLLLGRRRGKLVVA